MPAICCSAIVSANDDRQGRDPLLPAGLRRHEHRRARHRRAARHRPITRTIELRDFAGLWRARPGLAGLMTIFLLSLGGFPPTAGFIGKWYIFSAAVQEGHYWLAIIGVLTSVVSVFFYLRIVVMMYMTEGSDAPAARVVRGRNRRARAGDARRVSTSACCRPGPSIWRSTRSPRSSDRRQSSIHANGWTRLLALDCAISGRGRSSRAHPHGVQGRKALHAVLPTIQLPSATGRVLDFGCGVGRTFPFLRRIAGHVTGFDLPPMIERCRTLAAEPADALVGRLAALRTQRFDLIVSVLVLQHIEPAACSDYLRDFARMAPAVYLLSRADSDFGTNVFAAIAATGLFDGRRLRRGRPRSCDAPAPCAPSRSFGEVCAADTAAISRSFCGRGLA